MIDTTKAPHCPKCGWKIVRPVERPSHSGSHKFPEWTLWCDGCGFRDTHPDAVMSIPDRAEAVKYARQRVRAELARQALDLWTRLDSDISYDNAQRYVLKAYEWLGAHPLRLPEEDA